MTSVPDPRILYFLGRRIERLLLGGALLVVFCFVVTYLATANAQLFKDRSYSAVSAALARLEEEEKRLDMLFKAKGKGPVSELTSTASSPDPVSITRQKLGLPPSPSKSIDKSSKVTTYGDALIKIADEASDHSHAGSDGVRKLLDPSKSPSDLIKALKEHKSILDNTPSEVWGVQTPKLVQLKYAGADFKVPFGFLSSTFSVALGLFAVGWLGALYMTRQRELAMIACLKNYKQAFPHVLNFLPVRLLEMERRFNPRKKGRRVDIQNKINRGLQAICRIVVLLLFAAPLTLGFGYSLSQLWLSSGNSALPLYLSGGFMFCVMVTQVLMLVAQEWLLLSGKEFYE